GFGIKLGLLDVAVTVKLWVSLVAPVVMPARFTVCSPAPSLIVRLASVFNVGALFTGLTVTVKVRVTILLLVLPSFTVTVTVAEPNPKASGVKARLPVAFGLV